VSSSSGVKPVSSSATANSITMSNAASTALTTSSGGTGGHGHGGHTWAVGVQQASTRASPECKRNRKRHRVVREVAIHCMHLLLVPLLTRRPWTPLLQLADR
jgi:hypothetical protein